MAVAEPGPAFAGVGHGVAVVAPVGAGAQRSRGVGRRGATLGKPGVRGGRGSLTIPAGKAMAKVRWYPEGGFLPIARWVSVRSERRGLRRGRGRNSISAPTPAPHFARPCARQGQGAVSRRGGERWPAIRSNGRRVGGALGFRVGLAWAGCGSGVSGKRWPWPNPASSGRGYAAREPRRFSGKGGFACRVGWTATPRR